MTSWWISDCRFRCPASDVNPEFSGSILTLQFLLAACRTCEAPVINLCGNRPKTARRLNGYFSFNLPPFSFKFLDFVVCVFGGHFYKTKLDATLAIDSGESDHGRCSPGDDIIIKALCEAGGKPSRHHLLTVVCLGWMTCMPGLGLGM